MSSGRSARISAKLLEREGSDEAERTVKDRSRSGASESRVAEVMTMVDKAVGMTCPSYLRHLRHDIVQDAKLRLLKVADLDDPRFEVRSYLWKAAHSAVLDAMRAARRRAHETLEAPSELDGIATSDSPDPDRIARSKEVASAIRDCLSGLIDSRRRIVTLNLLGFGLSEIASMLGEERKRIDNLLYRGLVNLRECLLGKGVRP